MHPVINTSQLLLSAALAGAIVYLSYKVKFLNISGSVATFILAILVFGFGGLQWAVPILVFFILSSLLSKTGKRQKEQFKNTFEKTGVRDYMQVIANGGLAGFFVLLNLLYPDPLFYQLYLVALAACTADTWATEIGVLFHSKTRMITNFKEVQPGASGAISFYGTLASLIGSLVLALSGYCFSINLAQFYLITLAGFSGSIFDSFLGATFQGQYKCTICRSYTEKRTHCNDKTIRITGFNWLTNDLVNILSSFMAVLLYLLIIIIFI